MNMAFGVPLIQALVLFGWASLLGITMGWLIRRFVRIFSPESRDTTSRRMDPADVTASRSVAGPIRSDKVAEPAVMPVTNEELDEPSDHHSAEQLPADTMAAKPTHHETESEEAVQPALKIRTSAGEEKRIALSELSTARLALMTARNHR